VSLVGCESVNRRGRPDRFISLTTVDNDSEPRAAPNPVSKLQNVYSEQELKHLESDTSINKVIDSGGNEA